MGIFLSSQLTAQLLGQLFHSLEFVDEVFRQQATIRTVYVGMNGSGKIGEFLSFALEPDYIHGLCLLSLQ
jgi:hypothetical protein